MKIKFPTDSVSVPALVKLEDNRVIKPLVTAVAALMITLLGPSAPAQIEIGQIASRPEVQSQRAMPVLNEVQAEIPKALANIAAQSPALSDAIAAYRASKSPENALRLLKEEAKIANVGTTEADKIALQSDRASTVCLTLAAQCAEDANALLPGLQRTHEQASEFKNTFNNGVDGLRHIHQELRRKGITNEIMLTRAERARIADLLRLTGAAEICARFVEMDARATEQARVHLLLLSDRFREKGEIFKSMADSYQMHAKSFRLVAGTVSRIAKAIGDGQKFIREIEIASSIEKSLTEADAAITGTFGDMPSDIGLDDFFPKPKAEEKTAESGLLARLLRVIGLTD
jgi:hypothetical protein